MSASRKSIVLAQALIRRMSTATPTKEIVSPKFQRLKETQKKFAVNEDTPVHLKGGFGDKALYSITLLTTLVCVGYSLETFYKLTFK